MEALYENAPSRSWIKVSRSWEEWVNGLLRARTVENEEVLNTALRNGKIFKLYVNTTTCRYPVMKGEIWEDEKLIGEAMRTAASLLTEWDIHSIETDDVFPVEILIASGDLDHRIKLSFQGEFNSCFVTLTAPDSFSKSFIEADLKNTDQDLREGNLYRDNTSKAEILLRKVCLVYGWTYKMTCPEIVLKL